MARWSYQSKKHKLCQKLLFYNLSRQKRFFVDVRLKSSMAHYRLMTFGHFATFSSSKQHPNSYLVAQKVFGYCNFLGQKWSFYTQENNDVTQTI